MQFELIAVKIFNRSLHTQFLLFFVDLFLIGKDQDEGK